MAKMDIKNKALFMLLLILFTVYKFGWCAIADMIPCLILDSPVLSVPSRVRTIHSWYRLPNWHKRENLPP